MRDWDEHLAPGMDLLLAARRREPSRTLHNLVGALAILAIYTGLLVLGWRTAATSAVPGLLAVGAWLAWREHRRATPPMRDLPKHEGWSNVPAELEAQLAELRRPIPTSTCDTKDVPA